MQTLCGATSIAINFNIRKDVVRKLTSCREDIAEKKTPAMGLCGIFKILGKFLEKKVDPFTNYPAIKLSVVL